MSSATLVAAWLILHYQPLKPYAFKEPEQWFDYHPPLKLSSLFKVTSQQEYYLPLGAVIA
jgi:hypothetical protein